MLNPFKLNKHKMREAQSFVNYIFLEIICNAPKLKERYPDFVLEMVKVDSYKELLKKSSRSDLLRTLDTIYQIVQNLPPQDIKVLRRAILINNQIRELCIGIHQPVSYNDLSRIDSRLSYHIRYLCDNLYRYVNGQSKAFTDKYLTLMDYYNSIVGCDTTCHCCGIGSITNRYDPRRDPFDHFLPKSKYPFTSLNVHNLVPVCQHCNDIKHEEDTLFKKSADSQKQERIRAFYPFRYDAPDIEIKIKIKNECNPMDLHPEDINIQIDCDNYSQETENWERLYGIKKRYKAELCSTDMKNIYEQYRSLRKWMPHNEAIESYKNNKYGDKNIIKIPFMEWANEKGLDAQNKGYIDPTISDKDK